ncbi:unnamed protein product [Bursaphelenchus xylophilus]|uniref:(pine wood nematode) hypothetical protein n=1 Tax=Bursaphelenchus xylophilus TaxID=6326 RepID=A0A7I8XCR7_BURXY|nr:unnamed protein product [Bursaphelenchus xylophilus]CAG9131823.1 unnamed protein product [Bursaphelenchus xylophilus]
MPRNEQKKNRVLCYQRSSDDTYDCHNPYLLNYTIMVKFIVDQTVGETFQFEKEIGRDCHLTIWEVFLDRYGLRNSDSNRYFDSNWIEECTVNGKSLSSHEKLQPEYETIFVHFTIRCKDNPDLCLETRGACGRCETVGDAVRRIMKENGKRPEFWISSMTRKIYDISSDCEEWHYVNAFAHYDVNIRPKVIYFEFWHNQVEEVVECFVEMGDVVYEVARKALEEKKVDVSNFDIHIFRDRGVKMTPFCKVDRYKEHYLIELIPRNNKCSLDEGKAQTNSSEVVEKKDQDTPDSRSPRLSEPRQKEKEEKSGQVSADLDSKLSTIIDMLTKVAGEVSSTLASSQPETSKEKDSQLLNPKETVEYKKLEEEYENLRSELETTKDDFKKELARSRNFNEEIDRLKEVTQKLEAKGLRHEEIQHKFQEGLALLKEFEIANDIKKELILSQEKFQKALEDSQENCEKEIGRYKELNQQLEAECQRKEEMVSKLQEDLERSDSQHTVNQHMLKKHKQRIELEIERNMSAESHIDNLMEKIRKLEKQIQNLQKLEPEDQKREESEDRRAEDSPSELSEGTESFVRLDESSVDGYSEIDQDDFQVSKQSSS